MYKNILVAIDDSESSRCALKEAQHIARTSQAKLYIAQTFKKFKCFRDSHIEHGIDRRASAEMFDFYFTHFRPKALAVAVWAANINIG